MNSNPSYLTSEQSQEMDICVNFLAQMYQKYGASLLELGCDGDGFDLAREAS